MGQPRASRFPMGGSRFPGGLGGALDCSPQGRPAPTPTGLHPGSHPLCSLQPELPQRPPVGVQAAGSAILVCRCPAFWEQSGIFCSLFTVISSTYNNLHRFVSAQFDSI